MNYQKPVVVKVSHVLLASATSLVAMFGVSTAQPAIGATVTYDFSVNVTEGEHVGTYDGSFSYDNSTTLIPCEGVQIVDGKEVPVPTVCAIPAINNLIVRFNFLENTYTEQHDLDYVPPEQQDPDYDPIAQQYPRVYFPTSGSIGTNPDFLGGLSFLVVPPDSPVGFFILGSQFSVGNLNQGNPYNSGSPVGNILYTLRPVVEPDLEPDPEPEPEPTPEPTPETPPIDTGGNEPGGDDNGGDGGAVAVPEPSEIAGSALALGLLGMGWFWRRKQVKSINLDQD